MQNNLLTGLEHGEGLKEIIKDHPSLIEIDFGNSDQNTNKNRLKN